MNRKSTRPSKPKPFFDDEPSLIKYTNEQNDAILNAGETGEMISCLICKTKFSKHRSLHRPIESNDDFDVMTYLKPFYFLHEFVGYPKEKIADALITVGSPPDWFQLCVACSTIVDESMELQRKIKLLQKQQYGIKDTVRKKVISSLLRDYSVPKNSTDVDKLQRDVRRFIAGQTNSNSISQSQQNTKDAAPTIKVEIYQTTSNFEPEPEHFSPDDSINSDKEISSKHTASTQSTKAKPCDDTQDDTDWELPPSIDYCGDENSAEDNDDDDNMDNYNIEETDDEDYIDDDHDKPSTKVRSKASDKILATEYKPSKNDNWLSMDEIIDSGCRILNTEMHLDYPLTPKMISKAPFQICSHRLENKTLYRYDYGRDPRSGNFACPFPTHPSEKVKKFRRKEYLIAHVLKTHYNVPPWSCQFCTNSGFCNVMFREHLKTHSGEPPLKDCVHISAPVPPPDTWFTLDQLLDIGLNPFHSLFVDVSYPLTQEVMDKAVHKECGYVRKRSLYDYGVVPTWKRQFRNCSGIMCPFPCKTKTREKVFRRKEYLIAHVLKFHFDLYPWTCQFCAFKANEAEKFRLHLKRHVRESIFDELRSSSNYNPSTANYNG